MKYFKDGKCLICESEELHVEDYDPLWRDGNLVCENGHFIRVWDAG